MKPKMKRKAQTTAAWMVDSEPQYSITDAPTQKEGAKKEPWVAALEEFPKIKPEPPSTHEVSKLSWEPEPHPCLAVPHVQELYSQVGLLTRMVGHLHDMVFNLLAEMIRSGELDEAALAWLYCDCLKTELEW
jgi:hypothetical protein